MQQKDEARGRRGECNILSESEDGLDGDVHDHHTLGTEVEGEHLEGVGDQEAGVADIVEDTEDPDEDELGVAGAGVGLTRVLVDGTGDGPADEGSNHTEGGGQEQGRRPK